MKGERMNIGKKWKIESDELNVTLYECHKSRRTGHEYWRPHSYYSSVTNALKGLVNININRSGLRDLETVSQKIEELYRLIEINFSPSPLSGTRIATACKEALTTSGEGKSSARQKELVKTGVGK